MAGVKVSSQSIKKIGGRRTYTFEVYFNLTPQAVE
jgi:hypothetical protein